MFGLTDRGNKTYGELGVGNVLVWQNLHGWDRQEGTNLYKPLKN